MKDQPAFDRLFEHAAYDAPSINAAGSLDIDALILFAICRGQQYEIEQFQEGVDELDGDRRISLLASLRDIEF